MSVLAWMAVIFDMFSLFVLLVTIFTMRKHKELAPDIPFYLIVVFLTILNMAVILNGGFI